MADIELTAHGFDQAAKKIAGIGKRGQDATPAMRQISSVLLRTEQALWKRSGGVKWAPHPDGTKAGVDSGALRDSLTLPYARGAIRVITKDHMIFGTSLWYSRFMQGGTTVRGKKHAPKRPVLIFRPVDKKLTREVLAAHLMGDTLPDRSSSRKKKTG